MHGGPYAAMIDGQVPCSGRARQRVRLETEQPTWFTQVPWSTWSSIIAAAGIRRGKRPPSVPPW